MTDPTVCVTNFLNAVASAQGVMASALNNCTTTACKDAAISAFESAVVAARTAYDMCRADQMGDDE